VISEVRGVADMKFSTSDMCDNFFNVDTSVVNREKKSLNDMFFGYDAVEYSSLEYLYKKYPFSDNECVVDFGAGKGRPLIMAAYYGCKTVIGYEIDTNRSGLLIKNIENFKRKFDILFDFYVYNSDAVDAVITKDMTRFIMYNPFHAVVQVYIIDKIVESLKNSSRIVQIYLFSPFKEVIGYIESLGLFKRAEIKKYNHEFALDINNIKEDVMFAVYSSEI